MFCKALPAYFNSCSWSLVRAFPSCVTAAVSTPTFLSSHLIALESFSCNSGLAEAW